MTFSKINNLLHSPEPLLNSFFIKINQLKRWNSWLADCLSNEKKLIENCQIVRFEHHTLFIIANNAHWEMRLRFYTQHLITYLKKYSDFKSLQTIESKIYPFYQQNSPPPRTPIALSTESADLLLDTAQKIDYLPLRQIMEKIAKNIL